ncbi:MAG: tRNA pseudouridine(38-40) synthase TruA [Prevotella sp.]|nr:tRNA pseudouridine(38-40) synthase TruA [Prevotella sp.]
MRFFITLSYDGTRYHGWQIQPNGISVQQVLEDALAKLLRHRVSVTGAGRTDAGVHARMMVAHFDSDSVAQPEQLTYKLNRLLPQDIAVQRVQPVATDMHARFSALSRTYRYYIHTQKNPYLRHYSQELHYQLDFDLMNQAAQLLMQYDDFAAFCKAHTDVKTTICHITRAEWVQTAPTEWHFVITANRFLRNMVRAVVGTLIEVGRHRMTLQQLHMVIQGRSRNNAGESMPACALFLEEITY